MKEISESSSEDEITVRNLWAIIFLIIDNLFPISNLDTLNRVQMLF